MQTQSCIISGKTELLTVAGVFTRLRVRTSSSRMCDYTHSVVPAHMIFCPLPSKQEDLVEINPALSGTMICELLFSDSHHALPFSWRCIMHYREIRARDYWVLRSRCQKWKLQQGRQCQSFLCLFSPTGEEVMLHSTCSMPMDCDGSLAVLNICMAKYSRPGHVHLLPVKVPMACLH